MEYVQSLIRFCFRNLYDIPVQTNPWIENFCVSWKLPSFRRFKVLLLHQEKYPSFYGTKKQ